MPDAATSTSDAESAAIEATAPPREYVVLSSGALALRLPDAKCGRRVYLDTTQCVKVCEHGSSYHQITHWNRDGDPCEKPAWVGCDCTHARGLFTDLTAKPKPPADAPSFASVLWRDGTPKVLQPAGVCAVRIPGLSNGHEVWMDEAGKTRCPHGHAACQLRKQICIRRRLAASKLQEWWRVLDARARGGVRTALLRSPQAPSVDLKRAANVWRRLSEMRREAEMEANWARLEG